VSTTNVVFGTRFPQAKRLGRNPLTCSLILVKVILPAAPMAFKVVRATPDLQFVGAVHDHFVLVSD